MAEERKEWRYNIFKEQAYFEIKHPQKMKLGTSEKDCTFIQLQRVKSVSIIKNYIHRLQLLFFWVTINKANPKNA